jgi:photosystem II stability/assembly factor-like uncharacterized protein
MKTRTISIMTIFWFVTLALISMFWFARETRASVYADLPGFGNLEGLHPNSSPTVTEIQPDTAPNDLDTLVVISGTDFTAGMSGTQVITSPMVYLDSTELAEVVWVETTTLSATVPWGLDPGVYTLTVQNPDGETGILPNAFTVTQGIGVWTTGGPYGGEIIGLMLNPVTPTTVYALAHNAGVYASYDAAAHWQPILLDNTPNLLVFDAEDPDVMYLGSACCLLRTEDGGSTWESVSPTGCDGFFHPAAHPVSPGVIYVGSSSHPFQQPAPVGGLFRSDDYGETWVTLTVGLTDTFVMDIAFHPENPNKMLVGTRDGNVFLSTDGGETWDWRAKVSSHIERLYFNPFGAHEAWATTGTPYGAYEPPHSLYKSEDPQLGTWTPVSVAGDNEVWSLTFISNTIWSAGSEGFTTTNGGVSWSPVSTAGLQPGWRERTREFAIDQSTPDVIYAGDRGHGMFKSSDGGATWSKMNQGLAAVVPRALAVTPGDPDTIYAETYALGVLKSSNGGHSWRSLGIEVGGAPRQGLLAVDPITPTRVYLGGGASGYMSIQVSEDAGDTWHEVTATLPVTWSGWKVDILEVAPHPNISGTILAGTRFLLSYALSDAGSERGAIYTSDDYGEHWEYVGPTQPISQVVEFAFDAVDPNLVYAATYGTGLWKSTDGGTSWGQVTSFPGVPWLWSVAAHPDIPNSVYIKCDRAPIGDPTLFVSQDAGETWEALPPCDDCGHLLFVPPERGKPPYTLYAGPGLPSGLYRSIDGGYTWEQVVGTPTTDIYSLAAGSDDERVAIYVGISGGVVSSQSRVAAVSDITSGRGSLLAGGVYRLTTILPTDFLYLPTIYK